MGIGAEFVVICSSTRSFRKETRANIFAHTSRTYAIRRRLQSALPLQHRVAGGRARGCSASVG